MRISTEMTLDLLGVVLVIDGSELMIEATISPDHLHLRRRWTNGKPCLLARSLALAKELYDRQTNSLVCIYHLHRPMIAERDAVDRRRYVGSVWTFWHWPRRHTTDRGFVRYLSPTLLRGVCVVRGGTFCPHICKWLILTKHMAVDIGLNGSWLLNDNKWRF